MLLLSVSFLFGFLSLTTASVTSGPQLLFPLSNTQYVYFIKTNISCGTLAPVEADSFWTLEGKLIVQVYDNYTKVRYSLGEIKTSIYSKNKGYQSYNIAEAAKYLKKPWEVDYLEDGNIDLLYVTPNEPLWATNMKRALSINFQLKKDIGTYYNAEPCLYESYVDCQVVYVSNGNTIRKYNALHILAENSGYISWMSVPMDYSKAAFLGSPVNVYTRPEYSGPLDNIGTADRVYELDDKIGLLSLDLKSVFQHRTRSHVLGVVTELSLNYDSNSKMERIEKLDVEKTSKRYVSHGYTDPTNGIKGYSQDQLRNMTYDILLRIACKGIDADNIVKNASKIHNLDFVNLLKTMSQLDYAALSKLFEDMVLGTSYEIETSRNIFLEVLPHVRTNACALFIKHLIVEQKQKVEDSTILSLIRKLPFNVANHSQELLEELEVFTRLGLDFPQDIRHAGILSFATLVFKAAEVRRVKRDYFDNIIVKYFRMYNDCPQYIDRLVWLQGLSNIQYYTETYLWTVYNNNTHDRHERFWAVHGTIPVFAPTGFAPTWHILMDEKEHIQIRVAALHSFLSSKISPSELLSVHNYILNCKNQQLKRFWYTTVKSLENSKTYNGYRVASNYLSFLTNQVTNPDSKLWATSNYIVGTYSEESATGAMVQLMSVGDPNSALPAFVHLRVKTVSELMATSDVGIFIKMEGVASHMFKKLHAINTPDLNVEKLVEVLRKMKVQTVKPEKVHIEIVVKLHEKTVYVSHFNQTRFETWNGEDLLKSIEDFLRFGSHINQQMVHYPFQLDASIPTELGTPVRLQTALVSFSSIRGNLTAPSSHDLTLRNDLHIRYQGTSVTSLCTDGPLLQSEHIVRIQQSLVAHLPLNFDVSVLYRKFQLKWPNPASRNVGMAMHARAQIAMDSIYSKDTWTINSVENKFPVQVDETGVIFDCDRPLSSSEVIEKLLATNTFSYEWFNSRFLTKGGKQPIDTRRFWCTSDSECTNIFEGQLNTFHPRFLAKLRPSVFLLNGLLILSAPPSGSCGLMFGGKRPKSNDTMLKLTVQFEDLFYDPDTRLDLKMVHNILYSDNHENGEVYLNVTGGVSLESTSNNITLELDVTGHQPDAADPSMRTWKFCLQEQDIRHGRKDQDIITSPAPYEGHLMLSFASGNVSKTCPAEGSQFLFHYRGVPTNISDSNLERYFEIKISGSKLPKLNFPNEYSFSTYPAISQILSNFNQDPLNVTAVIQEKNGIASVTIDSGSKMQFKAENLAWLLDSWSNMQIMKRLGIYRECRLQDTMIQTLSGYIDRLPPLECGESLALADCTETPRFAVLRTKSGGIKLYTGGNYVTIGLSGGAFKIDVNGDPVECHEGCVYPMNQSIYDFKITSLDDAVKVHSRLSGVLVYYTRDEVVLLVPHSYMATSCGECVHQHYYRRC